MINLHTNLSSLIAQYGLEKTTLNINNAIERLSTGYKINQAKDNAANYSIATNMTTKINSYQVAEENVAVASDMLQYADSLLSEISNRMERLRYLQEQAINGTYGNQSLSAINNEVNALVDEINRMYSTAEYNGIKLFAETETDANGKSVVVQDVFATETTTFAELEIGASSFSVYTSDGSLVSTYDVAEDDSLGDLISILNSEGLNANLDNGQITITSNNNKYIAGDLADSLGISITQKNYVESTTQSFDVNIPVVEETVKTVTTYTTNTIESTVTETIYTTTTTETTSTETVYVTTTVETTQTSTIYATTTVETTQTSTTELEKTTYITKSNTLQYEKTVGFIDNPATYTDEEVAAMTRVADVSTFTSGSKYSITTVAELQKLANYVNFGKDTTGVEFVLGADLDLSSISNWTSIGNGESNYFKGVFDGNGHIIKNMTVKATTGHNGLFGSTSATAVIKNLGVENACITSTGDVGAAGILVGRSYSTITNCYTTGLINSSFANGGLVGFCVNGSIAKCYSEATVLGYEVGGLIGRTMGSNNHITNCYATGDVTDISTGYAGGLIGAINSPVNMTNCYATGNVKAYYRAGGLIGGISAAENSVISNCYSTGSVRSNNSLGIDTSSDWDSTMFTFNNTVERTVTLNVTAGTNFAQLGLDSATTLIIKNTSGGTIFSATSSKTFNDLLNSLGNKVSLKNGVLTFTTDDVYIDTSSSFFTLVPVTSTTSISTVTQSTTETILVENVEEIIQTNTLFETTTTSTTTTNTIYTTITTSTTSTSTLYETTTTSTTSTETILQTTTVSLTGSTKFEDLGVKSSIYITVYSQGTRTGFSIGKNDTVNDFYAKLAQNNIASSQAGNIVTFSGNGDSYIKSSNIEQLLKLGSVTKTEDVATLNTDSEELFYENHIYGIYAPGEIMLQVGIASDENSQLSLDVSFKLNEVNLFRNIGQDLTTDYLTKLDDVLSRINKKQTEFGAMQNRLDSALDEISIQYENLISSRSTIRDADIGEVSAQLIQQQILQQAAATLLATANQTPSIALQLL